MITEVVKKSGGTLILMRHQNPLLPPIANANEVVVIWHFGHDGVWIPKTRMEMLRTHASAVLRPPHGWHRVLRRFQCVGGIVFEPRVKYSADEIRHFETAWLDALDVPSC